MAAFLQAPHAATVRVLEPSVFHVVENARHVLERNPELCFYVCGMMARRLEGLIEFLVNMKQQFAGSDQLTVLDGVLESLMRRQPRTRIRPSESTIRKGQDLD